MAQSYEQIQMKIAALQKEADAALARETAGVIQRIKVAIAHYGLTPDHLFGKTKAPAASKRAGKPASKKQGRLTYSDNQGNQWSGWGKRPNWLREALASGKRLEDFQVGAQPAATTAKKTAQRRPSSVLYTDGAGNSWTGRGPQPRWLKEAIAAGKTIDELKV